MKYKCDSTTGTCGECKEDDPRCFVRKEDCLKSCTAPEPPGFQGAWRGLMVKNGTKGEFEMGEYRIDFGSDHWSSNITGPN